MVYVYVMLIRSFNEFYACLYMSHNFWPVNFIVIVLESAMLTKINAFIEKEV